MDLPRAAILLFLIICFFHVGSFDYIMNQIYNTLEPNYSAGWGQGHFLCFPLVDREQYLLYITSYMEKVNCLSIFNGLLPC